MFIFLIIILLHCPQLSKANPACADIPISSETSYNCNSPVFSHTDLPNLPSGSKVIYLQGEVKPEGLCSGTTVYNLATLTIEPSTGTIVKLINIIWDGNYDFIFKSQDTTGIKDIHKNTASNVQSVSQWVSFYAWLNLNTNGASAFFTFSGTGTPTTVAPSYDSTWTINMAPKIYPCADANGAGKIQCRIKNLKVWYQSLADPNENMDGTTPLLIAQYKLNQYSGYEVTNSAPTSLGSAYFGDSTSSAEDPDPTHKPSWIPKVEAGSNKLMDHVGIKFDQTTQYVTIPTFPIGQSLMTPAYSMTIKLWVKLSGDPASTSYLFRYSLPGPGTDIFSIKAQTDRTVAIRSYSSETSSSNTLSSTSWSSIVGTLTNLNYADVSGLKWILIRLIINNVPDVIFSIPLTQRYTFDASNIVRLGGPPTVLGIISGVEIYSPGSTFITAATSCQAATCQKDLGLTIPSTCLFPTCPSNCAVCFSSQQTGCLVCSPGHYLYQSECSSYACEPGKYLDNGNNCQDCIANCERCSDSTTCDTCYPGFLLPLCSCPYGSVFDSGTSTCQSIVCIPHCDQCGDATTCDTCNPGFILPLCSCPYGSVFDSGTNTCQSIVCISHCDQCGDATSCDVCSAGFIKQGSICVCPSGSALDTATNTCQIVNNNGDPCSNPSNFYYPNEQYCKSTCNFPFKAVSGSPLQNCILDINEEDAAQVESVTEVATVASQVTNVGGVIVGLLSSSNFGLLLMESLTEMLSYIQYLRIDYPPKVYLMLEQQDVNSGGLSIITEIPEEVEEAIPNHPLPEEFAKNDTHSSFVANSWGFLVTLSIVLLSIGLILIAISCLNRTQGRLHSFLSKLLSSLKWNLFFGVFSSGYGFTAIFTALEFRTVNMDSGLSILSFMICLFINTLGFFALYLVFQISLAFRTIKKTVRNPEEQAKQIEAAEENWKSYTALFEDYKNDHLSQKLFLFIFMLRTYIHYSILGYLNDYPFLQTCFFTAISIATVLYLLIRRPMKGKMSFVQQIVCEVAIFIVNVCVVILSAMDKWEFGDYSERVRVGDLILAVNFGLSIASSIFMIIETISQIKDLYLFIKTWLQSRKNEKMRSSIIKKDFSKSCKIHIAPPHKNSSELMNTENLEMSNLDKSNDMSRDQLKPY